MSQLKLLIMDTGEHIIGKVTKEDETHITVDTPVSLVPDPNSQGRSMMFIPYLQFSVEEAAPFPRRGIRHVLTPQQQLQEGYEKQFNPSQIITPNNQIDPNAGAGLSLV